MVKPTAGWSSFNSVRYKPSLLRDQVVLIQEALYALLDESRLIYYDLTCNHAIYCSICLSLM